MNCRIIFANEHFAAIRFLQFSTQDEKKSVEISIDNITAVV